MVTLKRSGVTLEDAHDDLFHAINHEVLVVQPDGFRILGDLRHRGYVRLADYAVQICRSHPSAEWYVPTTEDEILGPAP